MNAYFMSLTVVSIASGIVLMLTPDESKTKKYVEYLVGVCILCALILPINKALGRIPSLIESISVSAGVEGEAETSTPSLLISILQNEVEESVKKDVAKRFLIEIKDVRCNIEYNEADREAVLCGMEITLSGGGKYIESDITKYLSKIYDCDITINREEQ